MSTQTTLPNGTIECRLNGVLHNDNGPAVIKLNGTRAWYVNDKLHRVYGPAYIRFDGCQEWFINGKRYREPHNSEPMPVVVEKNRISYDGITFIPIDNSEYEKYKYHPTGRFTKSARQ
jgi:hypothetical protein